MAEVQCVYTYGKYKKLEKFARYVSFQKYYLTKLPSGWPNNSDNIDPYIT